MTNAELSRLAAELTKPPEPAGPGGLWQSLVRRLRARNEAAALKAETELIYAQGDKVAAHLQTQQFVLRQMLAVKESERALHFADLLETLPREVRSALLDAEVEQERRKLDLDRTRQQRREVGQTEPLQVHQGIVPPELLGSGEGVSMPPVAPDFTTKQIEGIALKGIALIGTLPPAEAEKELATWLDGLRDRMPQHAMTEVERRLREFRQTME